MFASIGTIGSYAAPAPAGFAQVQKKEFASSGDNANHSITFDSPPTEGNMLFFFLCADDTVTVGPSGFSLAVEAHGFTHGYIYYKVAGASESSTISVTIASALGAALQAFEYSGMSATPLDRTASNNSAGDGTTITTGTTLTTTQAEELIFVSANMRMDVGGQSVTAWNNSFVIENEVISTGSVTNMLLNVAAKEVSATATYTATGTITAGGLGEDVGLIATFKKA